MAGKPVPIEQRFWPKVRKTDGCWEWIASQKGKPGKNYGIVTFRQRFYGAHQVSWILANGEIPNGYYVCHKCDNRLCVRPDHLFLGTPTDNSQDCIKKGRFVAGGRRKLTLEDARKIRAEKGAGEATSAIAKRYGLCFSHVWGVINNRCWKEAVTHG